MHPIISDGWSMGTFFREVSALYNTYDGLQPSPLPELPIHYGDYVVSQREWLQGETRDKLLNYWKAQFAGIKG